MRILFFFIPSFFSHPFATPNFQPISKPGNHKFWYLSLTLNIVIFNRSSQINKLIISSYIPCNCNALHTFCLLQSTHNISSRTCSLNSCRSLHWFSWNHVWCSKNPRYSCTPRKHTFRCMKFRSCNKNNTPSCNGILYTCKPKLCFLNFSLLRQAIQSFPVLFKF